MSASIPLDVLMGWLLASVRLAALLTAAPLFGHLAIPPRVRIGMALVLAFAVAPALPFDPAALDAIGFAGMVVSEALIGLALGFLAQLVFSGFALLGEFISVQGGLGAARVLDPASGVSSVALASALQSFALLVYLSIGGHHELLRAAAHSFEQLPMGGAGLSPAAFAAIAAGGAVVYEIAVRLALPVTVAMVVSNAGLGLLGRAIPQLNLMTLQLPAHVAALLLLLALGARPLVDAMAATLRPWSEGVLATVVR